MKFVSACIFMCLLHSLQSVIQHKAFWQQVNSQFFVKQSQKMSLYHYGALFYEAVDFLVLELQA